MGQPHVLIFAKILSMATSNIVCPNCQHQFEPTDAIREEVQKELRIKAAEWQKQKGEEYKKKEDALLKQLQDKDNEVDKKVQLEKQKLQVELQASIRKSIAGDFENELKMLKQSVADNAEKLKTARGKELEFLQKEQEFKTKEEQLELTLQKRLNNEREKLANEIRGIESQKLQQKEDEFKLKLAEKEKQLDDQKKLAEEMRRKAEQGSMQLQGEVQELLLEDILRTGFPFDKIVPVGKGVRGADCMQVICNPFGNECGKIIYESKRTNSFSNDWIDKLKADKRSQGADIAVIVTQTLPRDMERFGAKDDVFICTFAEVKSLSTILRDSVIKTFAITKNQENKGDKMHLLYDYLTSNEFADQWKAIREGFMSMRLSIQRERDTMEKLWKAREKQLEKVLLNAAHIRGSIEGIAGADAVNLELIEDNDPLMLD